MTTTDKPKRKRKPKPPDEPTPAVIAKPFLGNDGPPSVLGWTPEQYHADRTMLTRGMIADFIESPALFRGRWIDGTIPTKQPTDAMRLGSAFHAMILGGFKYVVWDGGPRRGKDWERFAQSAAETDHTILTRLQFTSLRGMIDALKADEFVGPALRRKDLVREHAIAWTNEATGLRCKAMVDCMVGGDGGGVVLDWKSTTDPSPESWVPLSRRMGGHLQISHYLEGLWNVYGHFRWIYVVVGTEPPHDVHLLEPSEDVMRVGDDAIGAALEGIRELIDAPAGTPWRHPNAGRIVEYTYPGWFLRENGEGEL